MARASCSPTAFPKVSKTSALYYDGSASFTHSIGVIAGKLEDAPLLQFAAVYLRSTLARYFLMMRGWKMLCERNGVHLTEVEAFPFFRPEDAPDADAAITALETVKTHVAALTALPELEQGPRYAELRDELDNAIFDYFGLTDKEQVLVRETVEVLMPSIRPRSFKSLDTPAQHRVAAADFDIYAAALAEALTSWRTKTRGRGRFRVDVIANDPSRSGPSGIVRITYVNKTTAPAAISATVSDELVIETLAQLRKGGLRVVASGDFLALLPDVHVWIDGALYLVRPLSRKSWTVRQAMRDAEHVVRTVQSRQAGSKTAVPA